jgi:hypothetical protein
VVRVCGRTEMRLSASRKLYAVSMNDEDGKTYSKRRNIREFEKEKEGYKEKTIEK